MNNNQIVNFTNFQEDKMKIYNCLNTNCSKTDAFILSINEKISSALLIYKNPSAQDITEVFIKD